MKRLLGRLVAGSVLTVGLVLCLEIALSGGRAAPGWYLLLDPVGRLAAMGAAIQGLPSGLEAPLPGAPPNALLSVTLRLVLPLAFAAAASVLAIGGAARALLPVDEVKLESMPDEGLVHPKPRSSADLRNDYFVEKRRRR